MSLVSEALKKAEREAAARDARAKGQPEPFEAPLQPYRSRHAGGRNRSLVAALALAGGAAAIAIALLLLRPPGRKEAPVMEKTAAAPEARALPPAPSTAVPGASAGSNPFARPAPGAPPSPAGALPGASQAPPSLLAPLAAVVPTPPSPAATVPAPMPAASEPTAPPLATSPLPKSAQRPPPPSPSVSEPPASKPAGLPAAPARAISQGAGDYLRNVEFADGTKLELGGIVYSEAAPFAYLNGRLVGVGEFVLGRRIDRIDRDKVILTGDSGEIILRLKAP